MPRLVRFAKMKAAALKRVKPAGGKPSVAGAKPDASAMGVAMTKPSVPKPPKPRQSRGVL